MSDNKKQTNYGKIIMWILIILVVVVGAIIGIRAIINSQHPEKDERPVVRVENPQKRDITVYTEQIGTVHPAETVNVLAMMSGEILEVKFNAGDKVKKGDELVVINSDGLKSVEIQVESAKIQLDAAKDNLERMTELYKTGAISQSQYEQVQAAADGAQLAYDAAKEQYDIQKKYSHITAPISGTVEYKNAKVHDFAQQGTPVAVISVEGKNMVEFGVTDDSVNSIEIGDKVLVQKQGYESTGTITEVNGMIGQNGLYNVKADLDLEGDITNNSRVVVTVVKKHAEDALSVPLSAIYHSGDTAFVYTVGDDNIAVKKDVETGVYDDTNIEIVSGLNEKDNVVYTWSKEIFDGAEVIVSYQ